MLAHILQEGIIPSDNPIPLPGFKRGEEDGKAEHAAALV